MKVIYITKKEGFSPGKSPFERNAVPVIADLLEYLDLRSRLYLAATCQTLRRTVFGRNLNGNDYHGIDGVDDSVKAHWEQLDFSNIPGKEKLTDFQLRAILENIGAASVVKVLRLGGCHGLRGTSLAALQGSTILRRVEFWSSSVTITRDFVLRLFRPLLRRSIYRRAEVFIHYAPSFNDRLSLNKTATFTYRYLTRQDRAFCNSCGIQRRETTMTPCGRCGSDLCERCCDVLLAVKKTNHCRCCENMLSCAKCSPLGFLTSLVNRRICPPCSANLSACFANVGGDGCFPSQHLR